MKVAPFRALTQFRVKHDLPAALCRNEGRPFQGIDTSLRYFVTKTRVVVEMKVAPFRALTR